MGTVPYDEAIAPLMAESNRDLDRFVETVQADIQDDCDRAFGGTVPAPKPLTAEEANRFAYHPPKDARAMAAHEAVRLHAHRLADALADLVPAGRHREHAINAVQEAMLWANAGIACDLNPPQDG